MKISKESFKRFSLWAIGCGAVFSPIGLAIACSNSSSTEEKFDRSNVEAELSKVKLASASNHSALIWENTPQGTSWSKGFNFLAGNFPTLEDAKKASSAVWLSALPTSLDVDSDKRFLWARAVTSTNEYSDDYFFDLTTSSKVQDVKVLINALPSFRQMDLSKIEFLGHYSEAVINTSKANIISGVGVELKSAAIANGEWKRLSDFQTLVRQSTTISAANFTTISARLYNAEDTKYELTNNSETPNIINRVSFRRAVNLDEWTSSLQAIIIDQAASNHSALVFNSTTNALSVQLSGHDFTEFSTNEYATIDAIRNAESMVSFSNNLPISTSYLFGPSRNLWARARVINPAIPNSQEVTYTYINLTSSSGIRTVKTLIDAIPGFNATNLSEIKIGGTIMNITFNDSSAILASIVNTNFIKYEFTVGSLKFTVSPKQVWPDLTNFIYVSYGTTSVTEQTLRTISVRLVSADESMYILRDDKAAQITTTIDFTASTPRE